MNYRKLLWMLPMLAAGSVWAQGALELEPTPSELACLVTPPNSAPRYPADALTFGIKAVVRVKLTFSAPDSPPSTEFVFNDSKVRSLEDAVREHVKAYRMPCLGSKPVTATQEFQFLPERSSAPVFWQPRPDEDEVVAHCTEFEAPKILPNFPSDVVGRHESGLVIVRVTFASVGAPPEVDIVYRSHAALVPTVRRYVKQYRLTKQCPGEGAKPVKAKQIFSFEYQGADRAVIKRHLELSKFLGAIKDVQRQGVRFDLNTMACPFNLKFVSYRPFDANTVGEVGNRNPGRRELLEWLRTVQFDVDENALRQITGQEVTIGVPCGVVDLL